MPFIETQLACAVCQGKGEFKPMAVFASVYRDHSKTMKIECDNCRGRGLIPHRVFVNGATNKPIPDCTQPYNSVVDPYISNEEVNELAQELKNTKTKKKETSTKSDK